MEIVVAALSSMSQIDTDFDDLLRYGINTYNGALCINAVLLAIWPSFANVRNGLPESANITTQMMTCMNIIRNI